MKPKTMRIIIEGPQGCGKTRLAMALKSIFAMAGRGTTLLDDGELGNWKGRDVDSGEILIVTRTIDL